MPSPSAIELLRHATNVTTVTMIRAERVSVLVASALVVSALGGCGRSPELGLVEGTVKLNGKPIGNVFVIFEPRDRKLPRSRGLTDDEGHFELRCDNARTGAVVGEHRVVLVDSARFPAGADAEEEPLPEGANAPRSRIPLQYTRADQTPLNQTVASGSQSVLLEARGKSY